MHEYFRQLTAVLISEETMRLAEDPVSLGLNFKGVVITLLMNGHTPSHVCVNALTLELFYRIITQLSNLNISVKTSLIIYCNMYLKEREKMRPMATFL